MCNFARKFRNMNKNILYIIAFIFATLLTSCAGEFNKVYKSDDYSYKYEYAKEQYLNKKYTRANALLGDLIHVMKGTDHGEECLYLYAMSAMKNNDYESASDIFKKYFVSYPKGFYAEQANYNIAEALFMDTPEPRLDQTSTYSAIKAYQDFMDIYPYSEDKEKAQDRLYKLQDKLVYKEFLSAKLYYNLGTYFGNCTSGGNNYEACIITAQNAIKDYPYTSLREDFAVLIMKSKYEMAVQSVEEKKLERYQDAEEECYGFINEYPESKSIKLAEKYIAKCKEITKDAPEDN